MVFGCGLMAVLWSGRVGAGALDNWHPRANVAGYGGFIAFGNGRFVVCSEGFSQVLTNGRDWNTFLAPESGLCFLGFLNEQFVAAFALPGDQYSPDTYMVYTSSDGASWTAKAANLEWPLSGMVYGDGVYVAPAGGSYWNGNYLYNSSVYTSTNLRDWTAALDGTASFSAVAYGNGVFGTLYRGQFAMRLLGRPGVGAGTSAVVGAVSAGVLCERTICGPGRAT